MSKTIRVTFVTADQREKTVTGNVGDSMLDLAREAGMEIDATCGSRGRCRSCRVKALSGTVPPPSVADTVQLGHDEVQERFRLSCQTKVIDDCTLLLAPPREETGHKILSTGRKLNEDEDFGLDSGILKTKITAKAPTEEHHQTSDIDEIISALEAKTSIKVSNNLRLELLRKVPLALRKDFGELTVTTFNDEIIDVEPGDTSEKKYGIAFDIGTTSIVGALMDLHTGEALATVGNVNPQAVYGGDLMSRIAYAMNEPKKLQTLRAKALNAVNDHIKAACKEAGVSMEHLYKVVVVGNTCMHHVFLGIDVTYLGLAPYAPSMQAPIVIPASDLPLKAAPNARVCLLPVIAGFVGADTIACVLATRIYDSEKPRALVDIGTNGEVVMGRRGKLMACSAPAGPALEGGQIRHGMRGSVGAIEKVIIDNNLSFETIGGAPPIGICGSGLIDAIAKMLAAGVVDPSGRFRIKNRDELPPKLRDRLRNDSNGKAEFVLAWASESGKQEDITLTQTDLRQLQLAKGAIFSGIVTLQNVMKLPDEAFAEIMLCGGFGNYISIESSINIRLLPNIPADKVTYFGNAALLGAQMALLSETERDRAHTLAGEIEHVALAAHPDFQDIFVDAMAFMEPPPEPAISAEA